MRASRRRVLLAAGGINVMSLLLSYTGSYTDTVVTIDGKEYRLLTFLSNGTLTLDPRMPGRVPFDVWAIAGGGNGGQGGAMGPYTPLCSINPGAGFTLNSVYHGCSVSCNIVSALALGGGRGGNGEWGHVNEYRAGAPTLVVDTGAGNNSVTEDGASLISVLAGGNASGTTAGTDRTRAGAAWFSLPDATNGAGGAEGKSNVSWACSTHSAGYSSGTGGNGGTGKPGIVYMRIPLAED